MSSFSIRLTHKIASIAVIGVIGVALVGGIHLYGESAMAISRDAAERARTIFELNGKIEIELLAGRRAEKDFLLRNDSRKADNQMAIGKSVAADIEVLRGKVVAAGKPDLARQIEAMSSSLKQYQAHFAAVVERKLQLGLDEKSGLEGRLRGSVHDIEARVDQLHETALLVTMLTMRRHEKDFMLRRDPKYGDDMKKRASEFASGIDNANIPEGAKAELKQKLADYQRDFFAWMETALTLANELKATSDSFSAVEPVIEAVSKSVADIRSEADRSNTAERDQVQWQMELAIVLPGLGRADEVGEIAQAVETFKVNAEQKARDEADAKIRQDQAAARQRKADMVKLAD